MKYASGGGGQWARTCDSCQSAPSAVYCRADAAFLCGACDERVHHANRVASRHERVWVCEACERAPAEITCRADAAALCAACDGEVHSANPLARRHLRVPILLLSSRPDRDFGGSHPPPFGAQQHAAEESEGTGEDEAVSWLAIDKNCIQSNNQADYFGREVDDYLDLVDYNEIPNQEQQRQNYGNNEASERVVPSRCLAAREPQQQQSYWLELEYEVSNNGGLSYPAASLSHSVSLSVNFAHI